MVGDSCKGGKGICQRFNGVATAAQTLCLITQSTQKQQRVQPGVWEIGFCNLFAPDYGSPRGLGRPSIASLSASRSSSESPRPSPVGFGNHSRVPYRRDQYRLHRIVRHPIYKVPAALKSWRHSFTRADMVFSPSRTQTCQMSVNARRIDSVERRTYSRVILLLVGLVGALGVADLGLEVVDVIGDVVTALVLAQRGVPGNSSPEKAYRMPVRYVHCKSVSTLTLTTPCFCMSVLRTTLLARVALTLMASRYSCLLEPEPPWNTKKTGPVSTHS